MGPIEETRSAPADVWLEHWRPMPNSELRLFCFPHAGGTAALYREWQERFSREIEVCPVQLPGRGRRIHEPLATNLDEIVRALIGALLPAFQRNRFALFGHSMGALVAFEVARCLELKYSVFPEVIFVSGARAPHLRDATKLRWKLPTSGLLEELRSINGTPAELLNDEEAMTFLLPIIRADFQMIETHQPQQDAFLRSPIIALGGLDDPEVSGLDLDAWRHYTQSYFTLKMYAGDHFFVVESRLEIFRDISRYLHGVLTPSGAVRPYGKSRPT